MHELSEDVASFTGLITGDKKHHTLKRTVGCPGAGQPVRIVEVENGLRTGRVCWAYVTWVETCTTADGPIFVLSLNVRMSTDHMPAVIAA
jgi:hypothetical protein